MMEVDQCLPVVLRESGSVLLNGGCAAMAAARTWVGFSECRRTHDIADDEVSCLAVQVLAKRDTREIQELRRVGEC